MRAYINDDKELVVEPDNKTDEIALEKAKEQGDIVIHTKMRTFGFRKGGTK